MDGKGTDIQILRSLQMISIPCVTPCVDLSQFVLLGQHICTTVLVFFGRIEDLHRSIQGIDRVKSENQQSKSKTRSESFERQEPSKV